MAWTAARHSHRRLLNRICGAVAAGVGLSAALAPLNGASAQVTPIALLAAACTSCHGVDGRSTTAIPALAGRPAAELGAALLAYRDGTATGTVMGHIAKGYSPEEIALLAAFFAER